MRKKNPSGAETKAKQSKRKSESEKSNEGYVTRSAAQRRRAKKSGKRRITLHSAFVPELAFKAPGGAGGN